MTALVHTSRRVRCSSPEQAYRNARDAIAYTGYGEIEPIRDDAGRVVAYQVVRPAPELLEPGKRHRTPPGLAEWEYYW